MFLARTRVFPRENGWFDKRWMDEVSSQVPLLMEWRGHIPPGTSSDALVQNIDFAPTLLDAAGVRPKRPCINQPAPLFAGEQRSLESRPVLSSLL